MVLTQLSKDVKKMVVEHTAQIVYKIKLLEKLVVKERLMVSTHSQTEMYVTLLMVEFVILVQWDGVVNITVHQTKTVTQRQVVVYGPKMILVS